MFHLLQRLLPAALLLASMPEGSPPPRVRSLLAAERDLGAAMSAEGARGALRERLAPVAVLLAPRPTGAFEWVAEHPLPEGTWVQRTEFAELSGAGDLGVTTGTWQVTPADGAPARRGRYASVWRWHERTGWKLLLGGAVEGAPVAESLGTSTAALEFVVGDRAMIFPHDSLAVERAALQDADRAIGTAGGANSAAAVARHDCADRSRVEVDLGCVFEPVGARTADSADLGYTFGTCRCRPAGAPEDSAATWGYVHVWRRDAAGKRCLALEFAVPAPPRP